MSEARPKESPACNLCAQIAGDVEGDLLQEILATPAYVRRVMLESENFAVVPSLGALVDGHVLAVPKCHACSFAQLETAGESTASFLSRARIAVEDTFGSEVQMFEHGTGAGSIEPACSVEHAHVHLVPCRVDLHRRLGGAYRWTKVGGEVELRELVGDGEYLRVSTEGGWMVTMRKGGFPSQLLRRELGAALSPDGPTDWNWRTNPRPEVVGRTFDRLSSAAFSP